MAAAAARLLLPSTKLPPLVNLPQCTRSPSALSFSPISHKKRIAARGGATNSLGSSSFRCMGSSSSSQKSDQSLVAASISSSSSGLSLLLATLIQPTSLSRNRSLLVLLRPLLPQLRPVGARSLLGLRCSFSLRAAAPPVIGKPTGKGYTHVSDDEWKKRLTQEQFYITRQKGTERAFSGEYWNTKTPGIYHCICCDTPLFESKTKFDSGTGWPSYYEPIGSNVKSKLDASIIFMPRTEVLCATCDAHLGHVFDDGPPPTRKRYCINSVSLKLVSQ